MLDRGVRQAGVLRPARARRDQQPVGPQVDHLVEGDPVVAVDDRLGAQLPEVLHEVVDERVVVVDDEDERFTGTTVLRASVERPPTFRQVRCRPCRFRRVRAIALLHTVRRRKEGAGQPVVGPGVAVRAHAHRPRRGLANYLQALPGNTENRYLIVGLVLITSGFGLATTYR